MLYNSFDNWNKCLIINNSGALLRNIIQSVAYAGKDWNVEQGRTG